jgi:hypothetical protein
MTDPHALALIAQRLPTVGVAGIVVVGLVAWQAMK